MSETKPTIWERFRKAFAAAFGALTPTAVVGVLTAIGVHIDAGVVATILAVGTAVLAPAFAAVVKPNLPKGGTVSTDDNPPDRVERDWPGDISPPSYDPR